MAREGANIGGLKATIGDVTATVKEFGVGTEYRLFKNFGAGVSYNLLKLTADISKPEWNGNIDWRTGGWQIYGSFVF